MIGSYMPVLCKYDKFIQVKSGRCHLSVAFRPSTHLHMCRMEITIFSCIVWHIQVYLHENCRLHTPTTSRPKNLLSEHVANLAWGNLLQILQMWEAWILSSPVAGLRMPQGGVAGLWVTSLLEMLGPRTLLKIKISSSTWRLEIWDWRSAPKQNLHTIRTSLFSCTIATAHWAASIFCRLCRLTKADSGLYLAGKVCSLWQCTKS